MNIKQNILETIGNTPLVKINKLTKGQVFAKIESFNPGGSVKDRIAYNMIKEALNRNQINLQTTIIEPTSGNTGIGLAMVCAALGLKLIIVLPDTMSIERQKLIQAYGAKLVLTPGAIGTKGAIEKAYQLQSEIENSFIPQQFQNPDNPNSHYQRTGHEIYQDMDGLVDVFVAGVGSGGTISGVGKVLKEYNPQIKIIAVEPTNSAIISTGVAGKHKIQGIGAGFIPDNYDSTIVDEVITISDEEAFDYARRSAKEEGLLVGISSGAALCAADKIATRADMKNKNIVVILADSGERYLSTSLYD